MAPALPEGDNPQRRLSKFPKFKKISAPVPAPAPAPAHRVRSNDMDQGSSGVPPMTPTLPNAHAPVPRAPLILRKTRVGTPPDICGPWEGKVASSTGLDSFVITSPMQDYVPKFPRDPDIIQTYTDGRWGVHEYSRHPQIYIEEMTHVACIPRSPSPPELPDALFTTLRTEEHWAEDPGITVRGLGLMREAVRKELRQAAAMALAWVDSMGDANEDAYRYCSFLAMLLRQVVDRMYYLPTMPTRSIAVAAHIQRITLELWGMKTYLNVVIPRMESPHDYSHSLLDVVGGFVREGAVTQTWHRIGIPFWVLQPLTASLVMWNIVHESALPWELSNRLCDPPILHRAGAFVGVSNLTGNWVNHMVLSVSTHIAGSHLSSLKLGATPDIPMGNASSSKRPHTDERSLTTAHLKMRPAEQGGSGDKLSRRQRRRQTGQVHLAPGGGPLAPGTILGQPTNHASGGDTPHPSRHLMLCPFLELSDIWADALRAVSPVAQSSNSALYFYPPPFLLDTIASKTPPPAGCAHPSRAREDTKVNRYLHNLVHIRNFCRARLFDISMDNRALTVSEWRAELWGDYQPQNSVRAGGQGSDARRAKRHLDERNQIGAMFHKVAHMDSYNKDAVVTFEGLDVDLVAIVEKLSVRLSLLWESHEINFRAELVALDALLVQKANWMEVDCWEREMAVSGVWGPPSSAATVAASTTRDGRVFCWHTPPEAGWESCRERLRSFAHVLTRWPGFPEVVIQAVKQELLEEQFRDVQQRAVTFYVQTFVTQYSRLPIPPVLFKSAA